MNLLKKIHWKNSVWLLISLAIIAVDQWSKMMVVHHLHPEKTYAIAPFLNFALRYNTGAAFSFLSGQGDWHVYLLAGFSLVVSVFVLITLLRLDVHQKWTAISLSLILGGAVGNLIDRVFFGFVTDFVDFHVGGWHFATFNVADASISIGAVMLVLSLF